MRFVAKVPASPMFLMLSRTSCLALWTPKSGPPTTSVLYRPGMPVKVCCHTKGGFGRLYDAGEPSGTVLTTCRPSGRPEPLKTPTWRFDHWNLEKTVDSAASRSKGYMLL